MKKNAEKINKQLLPETIGYKMLKKSKINFFLNCADIAEKFLGKA